MHVSDFSLDLNWFLQFVVAAFVIVLGSLFLVKKTASKYLMVDANFDSSDPVAPPLHGGSGMRVGDSCVICGNLTTKQCSRCKLVRYCSEDCQRSHWNSGHKVKCKDLQLSGKANLMQHGQRGSNAVTIVPARGTTNIVKRSKEILFPYEDFMELFNWDKPGFPPCGLLNCGNSCFANVVLQCLAHTRPLVAYLLEKGHKRECRRNDWCFLCEFQTHVERASASRLPFSPISILSRLPNIGGNLGHGKQEDAHEFMRFAIDTMQSLCLDEFGGEKSLHPSAQETTLIQHIFGGQLQSQVICSKCNNISNQFENMMDLTVEIQGGAASLEECLDQFTVSERLHGDNMYKCDGCNNYVMAWKRLTVRRAPNILTIAFKRFQSGRFGKLNKRVTFPETLDLSLYMSEAEDGNNVYKLYAVVVHIDMLNASFFGHYICYAKDFSGNWYRIDDCKVTRVDLEEVLSQRAYMLLYSRVCPRPSCLKPINSSSKEQQSEQSVECFGIAGSINSICSGSLSSGGNSQVKVSTCEEDSSPITNFEVLGEDLKRVDSGSSSSVPHDIEVYVNGYSNSNDTEETASVAHANKLVSGGVSALSERSKPGTHSLHSESASSNSVVEDRNKAECNAKKLTDPSASSLLACGINKSTDSSIESSLPMLNGVCDAGGMSHNASVAVLTPDELVDEINSVDSKGEMKKMVTGKDLPTSSSIKDAAGNLVGRNSSGGATLKPLFPSGFLRKCPSNKPMKRDAGKAPSEPGKFVSSCNLNASTSGPGFLNQNGARKKDVGKLHSACSSPLPHFEEKVANCLDKDTMLPPSESVEFTNLCNGDSGAFVSSDKDASGINRDDQQVAEKTLSCNEELHDPCKSTP